MKLKHLRKTSKEYQEYYAITKNPMTWEQWQRIEIDKKIAQENFPSHNPPKKTLWDKLEKDPVYYSTLKGRVGDCGEPTMGNRKMAYIKR
jgi:hypothetical protein